MADGINDLGWRADGIERAMAVGGVPLERYERPGFTGGTAIRRVEMQGAGGSGYPADSYGKYLPDIEIVGRRDG